MVVTSMWQQRERVHAGRLGELWRATDGDRTVALRVYSRLPVYVGEDPLAVLERAATVARAARHPALATLVHAGPEDEGWEIAEQWVDGDDLRRAPAVDEPRAVAIVARLAEALSEVHARGGVHGAVQRKRVLLNAEGEPVLVGLAWAPLEASETDPRWSTEREGDAREVDAYRAPERYDGGEATAAGDVFALGCILYELLGGTHPFEAADAFSVRERIRAGAHRPVVDATSGAELGNLLEHALARDPAERIGAAALAASLT